MAYWVGLLNGAILASILALSLNLLLGYVGQLTVAHAAFAGVGAYAATLVSPHWAWPFAASLVFAVAVAGIAGVLVALPALGLQDENLILLTLAVQVIFVSTATSISGLGGAFGLVGIRSVEIAGTRLLGSTSWLPWLAAIGAVVFGLLWRITASPYGRVLLAVRSDHVAAESVGIDVARVKAIAISLACAIAGLAGALYAYYDGVASPGAWGFDRSLMIIVMVIIGGQGNLIGSVFGAVIVTVAPAMIERYTPVSPDRAGLATGALFGAALIVTIWLRPRGAIPRPLTSVVRRSPKEPELPDGRRSNPRSAPSSPVPMCEGSSTLSAAAHAIPVLRAQGLVKRFGAIRAVDGFDLTLWPGRTTALVGPNGAGKTTVFNLLCGYTAVDAGRIELNERDITGWAPHRIARAGMVRSFQGVRLFEELSVLDNVTVATGGHPGRRLSATLLRPRPVHTFDARARADALAILRYVGLDQLADAPVRDLPYAQQKLVSLARSLASNASVLLLDEPLSGVDGMWVDVALGVIDDLRSEGRALCIVEHSLLVVERLADDAHFMELGSVTASGTVQQLFSQERLVDAYFGRD